MNCILALILPKWFENLSSNQKGQICDLIEDSRIDPEKDETLTLMEDLGIELIDAKIILRWYDANNKVPELWHSHNWEFILRSQEAFISFSS